MLRLRKRRYGKHRRKSERHSDQGKVSYAKQDRQRSRRVYASRKRSQGRRRKSRRNRGHGDITNVINVSGGGGEGGGSGYDGGYGGGFSTSTTDSTDPSTKKEEPVNFSAPPLDPTNVSLQPSAPVAPTPIPIPKTENRSSNNPDVYQKASDPNATYPDLEWIKSLHPNDMATMKGRELDRKRAILDHEYNLGVHDLGTKNLELELLRNQLLNNTMLHPSSSSSSSAVDLGIGF